MWNGTIIRTRTSEKPELSTNERELEQQKNEIKRENLRQKYHPQNRIMTRSRSWQ